MSRAREREDAAHRFADAGWHVFPAEPGGKRPATLHGFLDGTTDHHQIQQWWRGEPKLNVAVATGAPGPDVVDVDKHKEGDGFAAFGKLQRAGLIRDPMAIIRTPSGGFHAYYRGTEHQRNGHIPGVYVDFRSQGGYVVAPPSIIAGRGYEVVKKQPSANTFDWAAAKGLLAPEPQRQPYQPPEHFRSGPQDLSHLVRYVAECNDHVNDRLFWAACRMTEAGQEDRLPELIRAAYDAGEDRHGQPERTAESALRTTRGESGRIVAEARQAADREATRSFERAPERVTLVAAKTHPQAGTEPSRVPGREPVPAAGATTPGGPFERPAARPDASAQQATAQADRFFEHSSARAPSAAAEPDLQAEAEAGALRPPACKRAHLACQRLAGP